MAEAKSFTVFSENAEAGNDNDGDYAKSIEDESSQQKSEGIDLIID